MDLSHGDEQDELRAVTRAFLLDRSSEAAVREASETESGYDAALWATMAGRLGLQGIAVPEEYGGGGGGPVEVGIVLEEMGRRLYCGPYLSTSVLAAQAVLAAGDEGCARELLPGIAGGVTIATVALGLRPGPDTRPVTVRSAGGRLLLDGGDGLVLDGAQANLLFVLAEGREGTGLYVVSSDAEGLRTTPLTALDPTRRIARLDFDGMPAHPVGAPDDGSRIAAHVLDHAAGALAAEAVGGAQELLDTAVAHAKTRVQFGEPIGSFQAVQHACANIYVDVESARALLQHALWAAATDSADRCRAASLAKAHCTDAYMRTATETIQLLGGIGVTWEHPAHLHFRRAKSSQLLFGGPDRHRDAVAGALLGSVGA